MRFKTLLVPRLLGPSLGSYASVELQPKEVASDIVGAGAKAHETIKRNKSRQLERGFTHSKPQKAGDRITMALEGVNHIKCLANGTAKGECVRCRVRNLIGNVDTRAPVLPISQIFAPQRNLAA